MRSVNHNRLVSRWTVNIARVIYLLGISGIIIYHKEIQELINKLYSYLISTWVFNSVYFETWWATAVYPPVLFFPFMMDKIRYLDKYKINPKDRWQDAGIKNIIIEAVVYCTPLMTLDTFMIKKYWNVDPKEWEVRRENWIQETRALPKDPPTLFQIFYHLLFSFILYDLFFYAVHFAVHKNMWLYKNFHAAHHEHEVVFGRVTNQLSVTERIALVLSANFALKVMRSHPLTRAIFVPLFLTWLVDNHCGYDLPFTLDKVVPFKLIGGSSRHYEHHMNSARHYQPFFTYIDNWFHKKGKIQ